MSDSQICLAIGENTIRLADASLTNGKVSLVASGEILDTPSFYEIDTEKTIEETAKIIERLGVSLKVKKKNVNVVIPDGVSFSQIVQMPRLKEKELLSAIKYQADQFIPMPLEEAALDLEIIYEDTKNKKLLVLIVAAPLKLIERIEKLVEGAGFIPESVENEISAIGRLLSQIFKPQSTPNEATLFINFGFTNSSIYFFHHGFGLIVDNHNFKLGYNLYLKELQVNSRLDLVKAKEALSSTGLGTDGSLNLQDLLKPVTTEFTSEIERYAVAVKDKYNIDKISKIFLFNYAAKIMSLNQKVEQNVMITTQVLDINPYIIKSNSANIMTQDVSALISVIGGSLR